VKRGSHSIYDRSSRPPLTYTLVAGGAQTFERSSPGNAVDEGRMCWSSAMCGSAGPALGDAVAVIQLPAYAPDLNPTEGVWSHIKRSLGNLAVTGVEHLAAVVKNRLKRVQYRPDLLDSFLSHTGLTLDPEPP
jgi:hypothetical protein